MLPLSGKPVAENPNRGRDHLANERTLLAFFSTSWKRALIT
jgi:uncharacterized membrane protein YidH (DUF202 family)